MDQVHVKSSRSTSRSNPAKMACEKASRRLRTILVKASRLGVSTMEVAKLPSAKKLIPQRDHGWKLAVFLLVMFGGGVIVALACTARKGCSKLEEIVSNKYFSGEYFPNRKRPSQTFSLIVNPGY
ncbi:hypothetical protein K0M31_010866 [Melipona bicolor]|uniref:Uncharacterized protein n=1 Tax=Melipona bicolor TaxID=60889 RepID=A0AA40FLT0_9HYME|nr:hypothetical protein K0M31_010866 [Melipona bicolor]